MTTPTLEELRLLHAQVCKALGDPTRIQILYVLHGQPQNVSALVAELDLPQPTVSRHLAILRQRALVNTERDGATVIYSLPNPDIIDILDAMRDLLRETLERRSEIVL